MESILTSYSPAEKATTEEHRSSPMERYTGTVRHLFLFVFFSTLLLFPGCNPDETDVSHKFDSALNQLLEADERGEAETFAYTHGIEMIDGSVRIIISNESEQFEEFLIVVTEYGEVEVVVKTVTYPGGEDVIRGIRQP